MTNYIFVTGGVVSSLGKGIVVASIGRMLKSRDVNLSLLKLDPYLNVDPGTMSPYQHGEVFVTADGYESDLDLGHYERFTNIQVTRYSNVTAGNVYQEVINDERQGRTKGYTVQITPHVTDKIKSRIKLAALKSKASLLIVEVGGTVGDIEGQPFLEAIRQMKNEEDTQKTLYVHLTLLPFLKSTNELKTKPTQHSVQNLRSAGIHPDIIICRSEKPIDQSIRDKISRYCDVPIKNVIGLPDLSNVYYCPMYLERENLGSLLSELLSYTKTPHYSRAWTNPTNFHGKSKHTIKLAVVGKYVENKDSYLSVGEAIYHAANYINERVSVEWIHSSDLERRDSQNDLSEFWGMIIPGGFGSRGIEGILIATEYARTRNIPYLGLCLGLHTMVIEFARNVLNLYDANSVEFNKNTAHPVICRLPGQEGKELTGATMRLGNYPCKLLKDSKSFSAYRTENINERHRHRNEINNKYRKILEDNGMKAAGIFEEKNLIEIMENTQHAFMVGVQFHPEFRSRPDKAHPLFIAFLQAAIAQRTKIESLKQISVSNSSAL